MKVQLMTRFRIGENVYVTSHGHWGYPFYGRVEEVNIRINRNSTRVFYQVKGEGDSVLVNENLIQSLDFKNS
jgi:hypothetical protein